MYGYQAKSFLLCYSIMLDVFKDLLCTKLCWHNRPGSNDIFTDCFSGELISLMECILFCYHWWFRFKMTNHLYYPYRQCYRVEEYENIPINIKQGNNLRVQSHVNTCTTTNINIRYTTPLPSKVSKL